MDRQDIEDEELDRIFNRLDSEVDLLYQALEARGSDMDEDYSDRVMRSQLESLGDSVESMSRYLGDGEKIAVTTPSQLGKDGNEE
jgi:hypothetical protein